MAKAIAYLFVAATAAGCAASSMEQTETRVLVFSKTVAFRHASIEPGLLAFDQLATEHGFRVDATEESSAFNPQNLALYDAVVFLSTTGDVLDDEQQSAFTQFIKAGGGFVGIHSASDTEYDWPWYGQLVGAYFESHPSDPNVREGTLLVAERNHPATASLPDPWVRTDEWYEFRALQDGVTVLLDIDEQSYKQAVENPSLTPRPIAWSHAFDGGRAFYTALGHTSESYSERQFLGHVWGGLQWALGVEGPRVSPTSAGLGSSVPSGVSAP